MKKNGKIEYKMTNEEAISYLKWARPINPYSLDKKKVQMAIDMAIKELEQPRWIPVSERLPESDEDILVTNGIGMYVGWIDATNNGWRVDSESEYFMDDIVAWMPLPKPYKTESEDKE